MNFSRLPQQFIGIIFFFFTFISCDSDFHAVGVEIFNEMSFETKETKIPVYTHQKKVDFFQTNGLPLAQLGKTQHPVFGNSEASITAQLTIGNDPTFGVYTQEAELAGDDTNPAIINENETVTKVFLEIPFFTNQIDTDRDGVLDALDADPDDVESDSDGDGVLDYIETQSNTNPLSSDSDGDGILDDVDLDNSTYDSQNNVYQIDSIYGNREATFNIKVHELTYFISTLDPDNNFETYKSYYSNTDYFEQGFVGDKIHDDTYKLNFDELRFNFEEDDPETEDIDETELVETRLTPRIRIPLDASFFQTKVIDQEGQSVLNNADNFARHLKGIIIQTDGFSDDLYMLLDINQSRIRMTYSYDSYNAESTEESKIEKASKTTTINLGTKINTLKNSSFDAAITQELQNDLNGVSSERLYLDGSGLHATINLFNNSDEESTLLEELREKEWLINEANLIFYVDQSKYSNTDSFIADRIFLYNFKDKMPLSDFYLDNTTNPSSKNGDKSIYGGFLEYDENNLPYRYKFKITDHINRVVRRDSTNVELALVVNSHVANISNLNAKTSEQENILYPTAAILNPFGIVLHGSESKDNEANKLELEVFYTEF